MEIRLNATNLQEKNYENKIKINIFKSIAMFSTNNCHTLSQITPN